MVIENILPIGTVVELNDIDARLIIAGYCAQSENNPDYTWDYSAFVFPIGYSGVDNVISFDADQIKNIIAYGYQDDEQLSYMKELEKIIASIDKNGKEK